MKKFIMILFIILMGTLVPVQQSSAQIPVLEIIKAGVKKVIIAIDLKIQRLQNKTIWRQNAQKTLENTLSKLKLTEISDWTEKQRSLYKDYFEELNKVKTIILYYQRIKDISLKQTQLLQEYQRARNLFKQDKHFNAAELDYMSKVYSGILNESFRNIDQITLVLNSFATQMSDAKRLEIIRVAANQVETNYYDLVQFNQQNIQLSLQRAKSQHDADVVKRLYGIQ